MRNLVIGTLLVLCGVAYFIYPNTAVLEQRTIIRVIDGDTVVLDGDETVRLIGVDTPETVHPRKPVQYYGPEASAFTKQYCGLRVIVEYSPVERTDRYGRTLAYIYHGGKCLNEQLISLGYARATTRYPHPYQTKYVRLGREAKQAQRGQWSLRK